MASLPGDFDGDGDVDGRDFLVWQRNPIIGNLADWQLNFGSGSLGALGSVPEPTTLVLLMTAAAGICLRVLRSRVWLACDKLLRDTRLRTSM